MSISIPTVSGINSALITFKKKGDVYRKKRRESNGLMIVRYGKFRYFMNDETFVSDPEHIILIPAGADYSLICDEDAETYVLNFYAPPISESILSFCGSKNLFDKADFIVANHDGSPHQRLASFSKLYAIFASLFDESKKDTPQIIKKGVEYINQNLASHSLTVEKAAGVAGVSNVYFRRLFGEHFGVSPLTYIQEKRIALAKHKMADRTVTLESIALECGYSSIYSFSAVFKKKEGISPSKYREKYGEL